MEHLHPTLAFKPLIFLSAHFVSSPSAPSPLPHAPHVSLYLLLLLPLPTSLRVLQWNARDLQAMSTELLLHFISSHPIAFICIQESNLILSSSFWIPRFSALRFDGTHSRCGIFFTDITNAGGNVIIFVRQGSFFSELSTSSLDSYSDYVEVNISLNASSSLSFLNVYAPPIHSSPKDSRTNFFSLSILLSYVEAEAVEFLRFRFHRKWTASASKALPSAPIVVEHYCGLHQQFRH